MVDREGGEGGGGGGGDRGGGGVKERGGGDQNHGSGTASEGRSPTDTSGGVGLWTGASASRLAVPQGSRPDGSRPQARSRSIRIQEPERRPLLASRATFPHDLGERPVFSCAIPNQESHLDLPVYTNILRIRRDIKSAVEDYLSLEQLRDLRINVTVIRPLVDKFYELDDISIVYCLLVNRVKFLEEQQHMNSRQNVHFTRATLCELIAVRILRRFNEDNQGSDGLLVLAQILVAGFEPFQQAPEEIRREAYSSSSWHHHTLPALEVAILGESKMFLSSTSCTKIVDAIYEGRVIYTPTSFVDIIPDRYKQKPISLYDPRSASLLNHYRLIVPRIRNILEIMQFVFLLCLYVGVMADRDASRFDTVECVFMVYSLGWVLDQFATILEHGWHVYSQNLSSFLDVAFASIYWVYLILRIYGWRTGAVEPGQQALDVLAMAAPVLIPRLAFNLLSDNLLFVSLRSMMADFTLLTVMAVWCFLGFLLSLIWLGRGVHDSMTISKWMIYIWFGLDGTGIHRSTEFHWLLGPALMILFAFLGNTLFLTILVSMLSNTFSTIVTNATAEIQFRHAVLTLEGVKSDAIFAYQPPFNILALLVLVPLRFAVSPRWFHKIHVASVRLLNLPLLLIIAVTERRALGSGCWPYVKRPSSPSLSTMSGLSGGQGGGGGIKRRYHRAWFWDRWRLTAHGDLDTVFDIPPPDSVLKEIAEDDALTSHMIRRQFTVRHPPLDGSMATGSKDTNTAITSSTTGNFPARQGRQTSGGGHVALSTPTTVSTTGTMPARNSPATSGDSSNTFYQLQQQEQEQKQQQQQQQQQQSQQKTQQHFKQKTPGRRDSIGPFPGLRAELRDVLSESNDESDVAARLEALEESTGRIETMLARLLGEGSVDGAIAGDEAKGAGETTENVGGGAGVSVVSRGRGESRDVDERGRRVRSEGWGEGEGKDEGEEEDEGEDARSLEAEEVEEREAGESTRTGGLSDLDRTREEQ